MTSRTRSISLTHPRTFLALLLFCATTALCIAPKRVSGSPQPLSPSGNCLTLLTENFDGVPPQVLPPGWLSAFTNGQATCIPGGTCTQGSNWTTVANLPDSSPNAAFHADPSCVTNSVLDTPSFTLPTAPAQMTFRQSFNVENTFDGGVLEISTAAAGFVDIVSAGGNFVTGGYNGTISTAFLSPIAGRTAWTGNSGGYISTVVNLPPSFAGQTVRLRFRIGSDCSVSGTGWLVDTISINAGPCAPTPTPTCSPPSEAFDDITTLPQAGWFVQNNSQPGPGTTSWFQGNSAVFPAHSGIATSYIGANFNSGTGTSTLSNWLLTPPLLLQTGTVVFYTRTVDVPQFPDRLQVRMSVNGASTDVGTTATSVGDFTTLLLDLNPNYATDGYPTAWTLIKAQIDLPAPVTGRLAFRYFVENGGPSGVNSNYIGIDTLRILGVCGGVTTPTPTASPTPTITVTPTPTPTPGVTPTVTPTPTPFSSPVITSPLDATGIVGKQCIYQFEATGADFLDVFNLPPGLNFDSFLSAITGVPDTEGTFFVGLTATNLAGDTTTATLTLTVQPFPPAGPVISSSTAATGRVGQPFNFHVITINASPAARLTTDNLPPGLSSNSVTGIISGTPTTAGSFSVALTVVDGNFTANALLQLTFVSDPERPVIVSPDTASLAVGVPFSYTIRAPTSSTETTVYTLIGGLPAGLGFDPVAGTISGTWSPQPGKGNKRPDAVELTGGALVGSVQLFGTNSSGTGTIQLLFLAAPSGVVNISTRMLVGTGDNVLIGGFIVTGNAPKVVITRALGPSLTSVGISGALSDPMLELHDAAHPEIVITNSNWRDTQQQIIQDTGIPPTDDRESAIVAALDPGNYTAIVRGTDNTTGVAVVEVYDLGTASVDASSTAKLAQLSTRGTVLTNDNVMIGGFIITGAATRVILRAIGPELNGIVPDALQDTVLELRDGSGTLVSLNDDWRSTQEQEIIDTGVPPTDNRESAIVATLNPGAYTGIVSGKNGTTGAALIEVYGLQ